jgi:microcystin-dependent protein
MANPFLGEIRLFSLNFAPKGWALCSGQLLAIQQATALFSLLGTTYGGNGVQTFGLPDLRGRTPVHRGNRIVQGQQIGVENVTVNITQLPTHNHRMQATVNEGTRRPALGGVFGRDSTTPSTFYAAPDANLTTLAPGEIAVTGGSQSHTNLQPYLTLSWCIALQGIFPARN